MKPVHSRSHGAPRRARRARRRSRDPRSLLSGVALAALVTLPGAVLGPGVARAQSHPCELCSFDDYLGRSPVNDLAAPAHQYVYTMVMRTSSGQPVVGFPPEFVDLSIRSPCPNPVVLNPDGPSGPDGTMTWGPVTLTQGGGACTGGAVVEVRINEQPVFTLDSVHSPDEDGDGLVALEDLLTWQQAFVDQSPAYQGDLDGDGAIALSDLSRWQYHFAAR